MGQRNRSRRSNGEGSIYRRADGRWVGAAFVREADGLRRRRVVYARTQADAREKLHRLIARSESGELPTRGALTVGGWLEHWLENIHRPTLSPGTLVLYRGLIRNHLAPRLGSMKLNRLRAEHVERALSGMERNGVGARVRREARGLLKQSLDVAIARRRLAMNPVAAVPAPRVPAVRPEVLSRGERQRLIAAARGSPYEMLIHLALHTGAREGELFALRWGDLDLDAGVMRIRRAQREVSGVITDAEPKTSASLRDVHLSAGIVDRLRRYRAAWCAVPHPTMLVFPSPEGRRLRRSNFLRRIWKPLLEKAGISRRTFHILRHTAATMALEAGISPKVVQERLGHTRVETTLAVYSHVAPEEHAHAAERLDSMVGVETASAVSPGCNPG